MVGMKDGIGSRCQKARQALSWKVALCCISNKQKGRNPSPLKRLYLGKVLGSRHLDRLRAVMGPRITAVSQSSSKVEPHVLG